MDDRKRKTLDLLYSDRREIRTPLNQALKAAMAKVPATASALAELKEIRGMGEMAAAEMLFKLWIFIETEHPGEWKRLSR